MWPCSGAHCCITLLGLILKVNVGVLTADSISAVPTYMDLASRGPWLIITHPHASPIWRLITGAQEAQTPSDV